MTLRQADAFGATEVQRCIEQVTFLSTTILSLVGLVLGAVLQFLFTRHLDGKKHQRALRARVYADYLICVAEHANSGVLRITPKACAVALKAADAKCRICLYGSLETIEAFAEFERLGANMRTEAQHLAFSKIVRQMREDSSKKDGVPLADLEVVLLGPQRGAK